MIRTLVSLRFRALFTGLIVQRQKKNKSSKGTVILFAFLFLYVFAVVAGMMGFTFYSLAQPYHMLGLDWLYFSMAGLMGLGFAVLGSVFTTQNQLYDAKDNPLLLSMPIPPRIILLSRMIPLLAMNLLFGGLVIVPATVVYAIFVEFSIVGLLLQLLCLAGIAVLAQAISCLLGWLLHLLLSKLNKSLASVLYLVVFLGIYFYVYSQAGEILTAIVMESQQIASILSKWVWPLYAMGMGCLENGGLLLAFLGICAVCFAAVYAILSATFLRSATMSSVSRKRQKLNLKTSKTAPPVNAIVGKELRKFLGSPVYLTNLGVGLLMAAALTVAGVIFREDLLSAFSMIPGFTDLIPLLICAVLSFLISTMYISAPSVSLEGKNIWILKSLPVSGKDILNAKLLFHCRMTVPLCGICGFVLALAYGCSIPDILLCAAFPMLLVMTNGLIGMVFGLQWARLDYINDAYPCKQSAAVAFTMFGMMGLPAILGLIYGFLLVDHLSPSFFLALISLILAAVNYGLYRLLITWGVRKWEAL